MLWNDDTLGWRMVPLAQRGMLTTTIMKKLNRALAMTGVVLALGLGSGKLAAQQGQGWPSMDPQQIKERAMEFVRAKLVVTNDAEWAVIEVRLTKVVQVKMQTMQGGNGQIGGMRFGGNRGGPNGGGVDQIVRALLGIEPMPEAEALQKAIENRASKSELKAALAKYAEARKKKQAELEKAQADLRQVLTLRQEGTLLLMGILD
jgi:hypothetical protein